MATTKKTKAKKATARASSPKATLKSLNLKSDAIELLIKDHQEVDDYFSEYGDLTDLDDKKALVQKICLALKVHTQIEEELFYPPARKSTGDEDLLDEAVVEHMGAKTLIAELEAMKPGQPLYDAKVKVLGEQVRHHVKEEEEELFPEVERSDMDLVSIGAKLAARKAELIALLAPAA